MSQSVQLIVNADDYGYFPVVSRGIVDAARAQAITATGIMANSLDLQQQLQALDGVDQLDLGVHLNLTYGQPLTAPLAAKLERWQGKFPSAYLMTLLVLSQKISLKDIRIEWQAQIEACQSRKLVFLNSHEHIHMLPPLFTLTHDLAAKHNIRHVRITRPDKRWQSEGLIRNSLISVMQTINLLQHQANAPVMIGLGQSGKLTLEYLHSLFGRLQPGKIYELMCHPGYYSADEIQDSRLIGYHDWQGELALLQSDALKELYRKFKIRLSHYPQ